MAHQSLRNIFFCLVINDVFSVLHNAHSHICRKAFRNKSLVSFHTLKCVVVAINSSWTNEKMRFIFCRFEIAKMLPSQYLALCGPLLLTMTVNGFNMPLLSNIIPNCSYTVRLNLSGIEAEFPKHVYPHHTEKIKAKTGSLGMKKFVNIAKGKKYTF